jgi:hypothetical protein
MHTALPGDGQSFLFDSATDMPEGIQVVYSDGAAGQAMFNKFFAGEVA